MTKRADVVGLGPTRQFPQGKMNKHDEGELRMAVGHKPGKVVLDFGGPVAWIGLDPDQADGLADLIKQHAAEARRG